MLEGLDHPLLKWAWIVNSCLKTRDPYLSPGFPGDNHSIAGRIYDDFGL
jgi:hypothetical protein